MQMLMNVIPIKSIESAAAYLKYAKEVFGNWTLAAASYNAGMQRIQSAMNKQKAKSYYDLFLNEETSRYMHRLIAKVGFLNHLKAMVLRLLMRSLTLFQRSSLFESASRTLTGLISPCLIT